MLETKTRQLQNPSSSSTSSPSSAAAALIAFKPRQVLLLASKSHPPPPPMAKKQQKQPDDEATTRTLLQQSVIRYLHLNGFSKTLKRFLKETKTEGDSWKSCSLNLEDMYYKYLNNSTDNDTNSKGNDEPGNLGQCGDGANGKNTTKNAADSQETISKKKKKKRSEDKNNVPDASGPESVDKSMKNAMNAQEVLADDKAEVSLKKQKEKKKKKTEEKPEGAVPIGTDDNDAVGEPTKKDKKKKKSKEENGATDTKDSKKRKRLASDENAIQGVEGVGTEESKRRKTEGLKESVDVAGQGKSVDLCTENGHAGNGEVSLGEARKSDVNYEEEFNSSAKQNSSRKERNGSAEPKTVNAFQRVKIDQVEFKDDRLKDNSYWAKDGAEIGYGAKAQEVLGQVKGRDFRHEKTKKKRGSYRGGLIDLQSHSVKFNYSDEE